MLASELREVPAAGGEPGDGSSDGGLLGYHSFQRHTSHAPDESRAQDTGGSFTSASSSTRRSNSGLPNIGKYIIDPRRAVHRYFVFFLACCFIPGPYFHDTLLGAYKAQICGPGALDITSVTFSWLFGLPAAMGALSGPMASIIARWGDARSSFYSGGLTFLASVGVVVSLEHHAFVAMLIFRLLFWLGLYLLMALQTCVVYKLFAGPELTMAMGFIIFACRVGGMAGYMLCGLLLKICRRNAAGALWFSVALVGAAALATALFACLRGGTATARAIIPLLDGRHRGQSSNGESSAGFRSSMKRFTPSTWIVVGQIGLLYSAVFPFETIETDFLELEWGVSIDYVGWFTSLGTAFGLVAWAWGLFITTTRGLLRCTYVMWAIMLLGFFMLMVRDRSRPGIAMCGIGCFGVAYSFLSTALWILLPDTLPRVGEDCSSVAVSSSYVSMSFGMLLSNFMAGALHDLIGYGATVTWFVLLTMAGLAATHVLARGFPINGSSEDGSVGLHAGAVAPVGADALAACVAGEVEVAQAPMFLVTLPSGALPGSGQPLDSTACSSGAVRTPWSDTPSERSLERAVSDENYFRSFSDSDRAREAH